jgi:hypothetical protein
VFDTEEAVLHNHRKSTNTERGGLAKAVEARQGKHSGVSLSLSLSLSLFLSLSLSLSLSQRTQRRENSSENSRVL